MPSLPTSSAVPGPSHSKLTTIFLQTGYNEVAPYNVALSSPNKETRVQRTLRAAVRRPDRARALVDGLLLQLRLEGYFDRDYPNFEELQFKVLRAAFAREGWTLAADGTIAPLSGIDITTGGRESLDEQLARLRRSTDDPGALLGSSKDMLEAVVKFVLEELGVPISGSPSFDYLWHLSRDRLGVLPSQVDMSLPGAKSIRAILQSSWTIAEQVNTLRSQQGTGHGRTLPTGVSPDLALLVVREACSVAEYMLTTLDRQVGRH